VQHLGELALGLRAMIESDTTKTDRKTTRLEPQMAE
jgi:hypothetical protein